MNPAMLEKAQVMQLLKDLVEEGHLASIRLTRSTRLLSHMEAQAEYIATLQRALETCLTSMVSAQGFMETHAQHSGCSPTYISAYGHLEAAIELVTTLQATQWRDEGKGA